MDESFWAKVLGECFFFLGPHFCIWGLGAGLGWAGLGWGWAGLGWLGWAGLGWGWGGLGLGWAGLGWAGLGWAAGLGLGGWV